MRKFSVTLLAFVLLAFPAQACENAINVKVNGLVCDFCARAIEKVMKERQDISSVNVNLDEGMINLQTKTDSTLTDEELKKLITDAGYSLVRIERKKC